MAIIFKRRKGSERHKERRALEMAGIDLGKMGRRCLKREMTLRHYEWILSRLLYELTLEPVDWGKVDEILDDDCWEDKMNSERCAEIVARLLSEVLLNSHNTRRLKVALSVDARRHEDVFYQLLTTLETLEYRFEEAVEETFAEKFEELRSSDGRKKAYNEFDKGAYRWN